MSCGVPQGSILGPMLFNLYTAPICDILFKYGIEHHIYADDTQLYAPLPREDVTPTLKNLEKCLADVKTWMAEHFLMLNDNKIDVLVFGTSTQRERISNLTLDIGNSRIKIDDKKCVKNLGVFLDSDLSMRTQITKTCQSMHFNLRNIGKIRKLIDAESTNHWFIL